jgi:hypothetical protein
MGGEKEREGMSEKRAFSTSFILFLFNPSPLAPLSSWDRACWMISSTSRHVEKGKEKIEH